MGTIPDEIRRHRLPGTEIKRVGGRFYIQRVKCVWVPELKRRRKVFLGFIGRVTAEGFTPRPDAQSPGGGAPVLEGVRRDLGRAAGDPGRAGMPGAAFRPRGGLDLRRGPAAVRPPLGHAPHRAQIRDLLSRCTRSR